MKKFYFLSLILISLNLPAPAPTGNRGYSIAKQPPHPLTLALETTNLPEIDRLIKEERDSHSHLSNPFHYFSVYFYYALTNENVEVLRLFLENGLNLDETFLPLERSDPTQTLLARAISHGTKNHVRLLLEYGADPFQTSMKGSLWDKQMKENFEFVRAEQKKRGTTLLLCLKEIFPQVPIEMRETILGEVAHTDNVKELFQDPAEEMELP